MSLENNKFLIDIFNYKAMTTREDILNRIEKEQLMIQKKIDADDEKKEYYTALNRLFNELYRQVDCSGLFDAPDVGWRYVITHNIYGINVYLERLDFDEYKFDMLNLESDYDIDKNFWDSTEVTDDFLMFSVSAKMLTAEEFSQKYGVVLDTIRKWIRRGKLRCAVKNGRDWLIPELAEAPNKERGFKPAYYYWKYPLADIPSGFEFLKDYNSVTITQFENDKKKFAVDVKNRSNETGVWRYAKEIERLEAYLIANPNVSYAAPGYIITEK